MEEMKGVAPVAIAGIIIVLVVVAVGAWYIMQPTEEAGEEEEEEEEEEELARLIIYHFWTAAGEVEAIDAVLTGFATAVPEVEILQSPIAGGGGQVMQATLMSLLAAGQNPDTFQVMTGPGNIEAYSEYLAPIDDLWEEVGEHFPEGIKELCTYEGHQYLIPINFHTVNDLWYNVDVLEDAGVDPDSIDTMEDFYDACEEIKDAGYIPLSIGSGQGQDFWLTLMFDVMLGGVEHGGAGYINTLYAGDATPGDDEAIEEVLTIFKTLLESGYVNEDYATLTWDQASAYVADGTAAFHVMGDWALGYFQGVGMTAEEDFDFIPWPGTKNLLYGHGDGFCLVDGAPHPETTMEWLEYLASVEAETLFNPIKGSLPPRTDAPITDDYSPIQKKLLSISTDPETTVLGTPWTTTSPVYLSVLGKMMGAFVTHLDIDQGIEEYAEGYAECFE